MLLRVLPFGSPFLPYYTFEQREFFAVVEGPPEDGTQKITWLGI